MTVVAAIVRKEIVSNLLSYKFFVVILLMVILVSTSFFIMFKDYRARLADYDLIRPKGDEPIAVVPPNPLSIFIKGLDDAMTRSFEVDVISITARAGQKSGNLLFSFFPVPDFLYIVRVVLSLVALLFGFDQVSREKETGTLKLMLANSVSRAKILAGKWLSNFLCLAVPFLLVTILGISLLGLSPTVRFSAAQIGRLGIVIMLSIFYVAIFLSLGIFVSTLTKRTTSSLVLLLFIWAVIVFLVPNLGTLAARRIVDVPSVKWLSEKRQQSWTREVLLGLNEKNRSEATWEEHYRAIHNEMDQAEEEYMNRSGRLVRWSKTINRISPAASFVYAATDIAGTGIAEEARLKRAVIDYKNAAFPDLVSARMDGAKKGYPAFVYHARSLSQVFAQGALFDTAWLVIINVILFASSFLAFIRYDPR